VLKLFDKNCPECGSRFSFRKYLRTFSRRFKCDHCGARLVAGGFGSGLLGAALGSLFISMPMILARRDPIWWWALIPGFVLASVWGYMFVVPQGAKSK